MDIISPVEESSVYSQRLNLSPDLQVDMLRLDLLHPIISGNKWYKLMYNLEACRKASFSSVLSFGGAYSNHLIALAASAKEFGMPALGVVRGREMAQNLNPVLAACRDYGMDLVFWDRADYARKNDPEVLAGLHETYPAAFIIPEGGANAEGCRGAGMITKHISGTYDYCVLSVGTGTTLAGLRNTLPISTFILGMAPMKGGGYLKESVRGFLDPDADSGWDITDRFHEGGFGKSNSHLSDYMDLFYRENHIRLDRVYTAKMMLGVEVLIREAYFPPGSRILCIHTGGLTGN